MAGAKSKRFHRKKKFLIGADNYWLLEEKLMPVYSRLVQSYSSKQMENEDACGVVEITPNVEQEVQNEEYLILNNIKQEQEVQNEGYLILNNIKQEQVQNEEYLILNNIKQEEGDEINQNKESIEHGLAPAKEDEVENEINPNSPNSQEVKMQLLIFGVFLWKPSYFGRDIEKH